MRSGVYQRLGRGRCVVAETGWLAGWLLFVYRLASAHGATGARRHSVAGVVMEWQQMMRATARVCLSRVGRFSGKRVRLRAGLERVVKKARIARTLPNPSCGKSLREV